MYSYSRLTISHLDYLYGDTLVYVRLRYKPWNSGFNIHIAKLPKVFLFSRNCKNKISFFVPRNVISNPYNRQALPRKSTKKSTYSSARRLLSTCSAQSNTTSIAAAAAQLFSSRSGACATIYFPRTFSLRRGITLEKNRSRRNNQMPVAQSLSVTRHLEKKKLLLLLLWLPCVRAARKPSIPRLAMHKHTRRP